MIRTYTHSDVVWIDLKSPTRKEVKSLIDERRIDASVGKELLSPTLRPRVELYDSYAYFILHFPKVTESESEKTEREIDFIIGKNFIVTVHYERIAEFEEIGLSFEGGGLFELFQKEARGDYAGFLFFSILRRLYQSVLKELDVIDDSLEAIEEEIFRGKEHEMVSRVSLVSRQFLDIRHAMRPHQEMLTSLEVAGKKFWGDEFLYLLRIISGDYYRITGALQNGIDVLAELRTTNNSLLSTKTNDTIKILNMLAFVTFPPMLFTSLFGMNTSYLPLVGGQNDFWVIFGVIVVSTLAFFVFFKYKRWL